MTTQHDRDEIRLGRLFAELRRTDNANLPDFQTVRVRPLGKRRFSATRASSFVAGAAAAAVLVAAGVMTYQRVQTTVPPDSTGATPTRGRTTIAVSSLTSWRSPTAALLRTPGSELLREVPDLDSSILDRVTPTIKPEGS